MVEPPPIACTDSSPAASWMRYSGSSSLPGRGGWPSSRVISSVGISQCAPEGSAATRDGVGISQPASSVSAAISRSGENSFSMSGHAAEPQRRSTSRWTVPERLSARIAWLTWDSPPTSGQTIFTSLPGPRHSSTQRSVAALGGSENTGKVTGPIQTDSGPYRERFYEYEPE